MSGCIVLFIIRYIMFSLSIMGVLGLLFLSIVSAEQNKQTTISPQQLCQPLPQNFLTFAVVQNPHQPHSKAMLNLQFNGNATNSYIRQSHHQESLVCRMVTLSISLFIQQ